MIGRRSQAPRQSASPRRARRFSWYGREYAINFGEDAEGAARLVSEILIKIKGWSPTEPYDMFTNVGKNNINRARNAWAAAHGFEAGSYTDDSRAANIFGWIVGIIVWIVVYSLIGC